MPTSRTKAYEITDTPDNFDDAVVEILEGSLNADGSQTMTVPETTPTGTEVVVAESDVGPIIRILESVAAEAALPAEQRLGFTRKYRNDPDSDAEPQILVYNESDNTVVLRGLTPIGSTNGAVTMHATTAIHWRHYLVAQQAPA